MIQSDERYNVACLGCGAVWTPAVRSPLWWKAKKRAEAGYLDAFRASPQECGCEKAISHPEAPYRVIGYDDMMVDFDLPFFSLVSAARKYLELARNGMYTVFFVDIRTERKEPSLVQERLEDLVWR